MNYEHLNYQQLVNMARNAFTVIANGNHDPELPHALFLMCREFAARRWVVLRNDGSVFGAFRVEADAKQAALEAQIEGAIVGGASIKEW